MKHVKNRALFACDAIELDHDLIVLVIVMSHRATVFQN
jgi:hypothetical protein